jgi:hypothetical protein
MEVVTTEDFGFLVAQEGVGPAGLGQVLAGRRRRIGADRDDADAALLEFWEALLETP